MKLNKIIINIFFSAILFLAIAISNILITVLKYDVFFLTRIPRIWNPSLFIIIFLLLVSTFKIVLQKKDIPLDYHRKLFCIPILQLFNLILGIADYLLFILEINDYFFVGLLFNSLIASGSFGLLGSSILFRKNFHLQNQNTHSFYNNLYFIFIQAFLSILASIQMILDISTLFYFLILIWLAIPMVMLVLVIIFRFKKATILLPMLNIISYILLVISNFYNIPSYLFYIMNSTIPLMLLFSIVFEIYLYQKKYKNSLLKKQKTNLTLMDLFPSLFGILIVFILSYVSFASKTFSYYTLDYQYDIILFLTILISASTVYVIIKLVSRLKSENFTLTTILPVLLQLVQIVLFIMYFIALNYFLNQYTHFQYELGGHPKMFYYQGYQIITIITMIFSSGMFLLSLYYLLFKKRKNAS